MAGKATAATRKTTWKKVHAFAMGLPGAWEDHPWGETVVKVGKQVFVFLGSADSATSGMSVKLTDSHDHAMSIPDATPTGYGLGKAGWVTLSMQGVEVDLLCDWVEESYRNRAGKKLIKELDAR